VSASVNLPLRCKVQKFSSGSGSPGLSGKMGLKTLVCVCDSVINVLLKLLMPSEVFLDFFVTSQCHQVISSW